MTLKYTRDDVLARITEILFEQFDIEASQVNGNTHLRNDLDIDSIDAVSLMIELKSLSPKKIALENFHQVQTIDDLVNAVYQFLKTEGLSA